jgi:hypothetical protein
MAKPATLTTRIDHKGGIGKAAEWDWAVTHSNGRPVRGVPGLTGCVKGARHKAETAVDKALAKAKAALAEAKKVNKRPQGNDRRRKG